MAYGIILNTYFLKKNGETAVKLMTLPCFKLDLGVFDTIEELRSQLEERIKDFKKGRLYYCDALDEVVVCDSIECIADDISCILKYRGHFLMKVFR